MLFLDAVIGISIILLVIFVVIPTLRSLLPKKEQPLNVDAGDLENEVNTAAELKAKTEKVVSATKAKVNELGKKASDLSKKL